MYDLPLVYSGQFCFLSIEVCYLMPGMENVQIGDITLVGVYNLGDFTCRWEFYHVGIHLCSPRANGSASAVLPINKVQEGLWILDSGKRLDHEVDPVIWCPFGAHLLSRNICGVSFVFWCLFEFYLPDSWSLSLDDYRIMGVYEQCLQSSLRSG